MSESKRRVLVIEDDPALRKMVRTNLERMQLCVVDASDGREAIVQMEAQPPDLVCMDLMLPEVSGYEVCEHIQRSPRLRDIPIIVISARALPEDRARALELGAQAYLVKPFQPAELRRRVEQLLSSPPQSKFA